jgi:hypothetical protein
MSRDQDKTIAIEQTVASIVRRALRVDVLGRDARGCRSPHKDKEPDFDLRRFAT